MPGFCVAAAPLRRGFCWGSLLSLLSGCVLLASAQAAELPRVVASIQPIHSLTAMVMEGVAEPALFWRGSESPHTASLRPSDMRKLAQAQLLVWVGPELETALEHVLEGAQPEAVLTLDALPGLWRLPVRVDSAWAVEADAGKHAVETPAAQHGHAHPPHEATMDAHLWLAPDNARVIVVAIRDQLVALDPAHAEAYRANTERALRRIEAVAGALRQRLSDVRTVPYLVFHDAYQYLERSFDLNAIGAVQLSSERAAGAHHLHLLRQRIQAKGVRCLFREPQFEPRQVRSLIEGGGVHVGVLDPLGANLPPGPEAWPQLLLQLGESLVSCLGAEAPR